MPSDPKLELHVTDSQLLGSSDSASLPSEPPDIRNWFSSYAYESNTLDSFRDFDASTGSFPLEVKKEKLDDIQVVDKIKDGLHSGKKESLDGIVRCNESDELEHRKHTDVVLGLSDSLPLSSEPPDIRNWFSSYVYETPPLDTTYGFTFSDYEESKRNKACDAELASYSKISEVVKCIDLVEGSKQTDQADATDYQKLEPKRIPNVLNGLASERISMHIFPGWKTRACSHDSVEEHINLNTGGKENNAESDTASLLGTTQSHIVVNVECSSGVQERKYLPSIRTRDNAQKSLSDKGNFRKENLETAFPENGFVSTRKRGEQANIENFTNSQQVLFQSLRKNVKCGPDHADNNTNTRINVLSDTTNFHLTNAQEIKGKWSCPQKHKPNLGPLLKQIRLEQWIRRV